MKDGFLSLMEIRTLMIGELIIILKMPGDHSASLEAAYDFWTDVR